MWLEQMLIEFLNYLKMLSDFEYPALYWLKQFPQN